MMSNRDDGKATVNNIIPIPLDIPGVEQRKFVPAELVKESTEELSSEPSVSLPTTDLGISTETSTDTKLNQNSW